MKIFIDTNIFAEYIFEREQSASVQKLFEAIKRREIEAITSTASIYTRLIFRSKCSNGKVSIAQN